MIEIFRKNYLLIILIFIAYIGLSSIFNIQIIDDKPYMDHKIKEGNIYYFSNGGLTPRIGIYKYDESNGKTTKLSDYPSSASGFELYEDWIYLNRLKTREIYRVKTDGTNHSLVLLDCSYYEIFEDIIYFESSKDGYLYISDLDGKNMKRLTEFEFDRINAHKGDMYIRRRSDKQGFRIDYETKELEPVSWPPK